LGRPDNKASRLHLRSAELLVLVTGRKRWRELERSLRVGRVVIVDEYGAAKPSSPLAGLGSLGGWLAAGYGYRLTLPRRRIRILRKRSARYPD
jgi:hypothetical protein